MQPLVLAIEPDTRQAAIVKRIVREKVLADIAVVDSRDAALEAMRTTIPDVLLLSALLSPRDEDELVAHLRTRRDAEHLQTHTIPQLASTIGGDESKPSKGLLSAFRRKKNAETAPAGCDPDLFAEEIRSYLQRASEKKREVRDSGPSESRAITSPGPRPEAAAPAASVAEPAASSSWDSPFEWRPSSSTSSSASHAVAYQESPVAEPEPRIAEPDPLPAYSDPLPADADPLPAYVDSQPAYADSQPAYADSAPAYADTTPAYADTTPAYADLSPAYADPLPVTIDSPAYTDEAHSYSDPVSAYSDSRSSYSDPLPSYSDPLPSYADSDTYRDTPPAPRVKYPLTMRHAHGWWFEEQEHRNSQEPGSEVDAVLESLAVPAMIAAITYAEGCRIRRVRLLVD